MTTKAMLDERYGRSGSPWRRRILVGFAALVLVGLLGYVAWSTVTTAAVQVSSDDIGFTVKDEHAVEVSFQFASAPGQAVTCAVEALDEDFGIVGLRVIEYPPAESHAQRVTETVRTVAEATTGLVQGCWVS